MKMNSFIRRAEKGAGIVEYALLILLVGAVAITALTVTGSSVSDNFAKVNDSLSQAGKPGGGGSGGDLGGGSGGDSGAGSDGGGGGLVPGTGSGPGDVPTTLPTSQSGGSGNPSGGEDPTPVESPTEIPTEIPTLIPTEIPTSIPTAVPTEVPTVAPTDTPAPIAGTGSLAPASSASVTSGSGDNNGYQTNPDNAFVDDGVFAVDTNSGSGTSTSYTSTQKDRHDFQDFNLDVPEGATIQGIEVRLDAKADRTSGSPKIYVQLSWDGGLTWTDGLATPTLSRSEETYLLGGATETWGHTWSAEELSSSNFRVRLINVASSTSRDFYLDYIAVNVTYQP